MSSTIKLSEKNKDFFSNVYAVVKQIPSGRVTSYGAIAKYLGMARSARMVGWAMNGSHSLADPIPAHRVVNRTGLLTGKHHFAGQDEMQRRLEAEGLTVIDDQIQNFEDYFWDPAKELSLD
jgi:methylated-DNA-protein-cysteine methyltransferase-like protein